MAETHPSRDLARRIQAVTLLLAASSLLSRVLGYGRDWLISYHYGATGQTDVYQASFTIPDMLNYLLAGGALTVSLLPRMAALYAQEQHEPPLPGTQAPSDRAFSVVFTAMTVATALLVLLAEVFAEPLIAWWFDGFSPTQAAQTAHLTRIVLPAQLFFVMGGLIQATLLARQSFRAMALTPLLYNAGIIIGGLLGSQSASIEGFSWGALVGALLGGLIVPAWSARGRLHLRLQWAPKDQEIRNFLITALPLMLGVSLTTVDEWLGRRYGSALPSGSISWLANGRRVMLVPIGLLGSAAGQATGAYIAKLWAEQQREELAEVLARSVAAVIGLSLVLSAFLVAMAEPVVAILFQYGHFHQSDVIRTASALVPLSLGIAAWGAQQVLSRAFFATGDTWRPMVTTTLITAAMVQVYAVLAHRYGIQGLGLAGTIGMTLQVAALLVLARRRLGLHARPLLSGTARALVVAVVAGGAAALLDRWLVTWPGLPHPQRLATLVRLGAAGTLWLGLFVVLGSLLRMPGMPTRLERMLRRPQR
jgi:putative peptidoglycan lipid II flippase